MNMVYKAIGVDVIIWTNKNNNMEQIIEFLKSEEGLKVLSDILENNLEIELDTEEIRDYGSTTTYLNLVVSFNGKQILKSEGSIN